MLDAIPMTPEHALSIERDPSQLMQLGIAGDMTREAAEELCGEGEAWACFDGPQLVACAGLRVIIGGSHAVAWVIVGRGIGAGAHVALTRFVRSRVSDAPYRRIEAIALSNDAERILDRFPDLDAQQLVEAVMVQPSRECRFAALAGLRPAHVLRHYGAAGQSHMLFERFAL